VSVVVPSHGRRLRLRWLLNALEDQTLPFEDYEVIVVHDYDDRDTRDVIERHPLSEAGVLRHIRIEPGTGSASRQRNLGWRNATARHVAFTDDDCRPAPAWLAELLRVSEEHPAAIVQGATRSDPLEVEVFAAPHTRSLHVDPPGPFAQTCNIVYPRDALERVNGFDEGFPAPAAEDLDLALRVRAHGLDYLGAPDAIVFHCVESFSIFGMIRLNLKWGDTPYLVKRHPSVREGYRWRVFWRESHFRLLVAVAGLFASRRYRLALALMCPYAHLAITKRGPGKRRTLVSALEIPGKVVVDAAEVATLVRGSVRYRCLVL
jgi:GT2 family glycosyltransferase